MGPDPLPGAVLAGRFRLEAPLGEGGMGIVWRATELATRERVALKLLKRAFDDPRARRRFLREARLVATVVHPNVRRVYEVIDGEAGRPALVMELLAGESLAERLAREPVRPLPEVAALLLPVVSAVGAAHAAGVIHRDLKPANVFVTGEAPPRVMVLDFGVAKRTAGAPAAPDDPTSLTRGGALLGTPSYMSPEQAFGEADLDHRTDVWSLGVILYQALSGVLPTRGATLEEVLKRVIMRPIPGLATIAPGLPADMTGLVDRMLARVRDERPQSLAEARAVLARHAADTAPPFGPPRLRPRDDEDPVPAGGVDDLPTVDPGATEG